MKQKIIHKWIWILFCLSCKSSEFSGSKKQEATATPQPSSLPVLPSPSQLPPLFPLPNSGFQPPLPPPCVNDGAMVARSLTQSILNGKPNQFVIFELSLKNCFGGEKYIQTNEIRFDYNAFLTGAVPSNLTYKLKTRNQQVFSGGTMDKMMGSDLFGNNSSTRFYWKTVGDLRIPPATTSFFLEIDVSNLEFHINSLAGSNLAIEQIDMYLSFANASPVTTTITYQNN